VTTVVELLRAFVASDDREEADRCSMLRLVQELEHPFSREEAYGHFTASAFVVDDELKQACLVAHAKLERLLQPGGHLEPTDISLEAAAMREALEETSLELAFHPTAPRPFDVDVHLIPERPGESAHWHLDVRYLLVGRGEPCEGAAWYALGEAGDESVARLVAKALRLGSPARG
jgi:ADP-ribose pyrophosphatase YjhB (NUDIX family)